ncbi:polyketide cyclase [Kineosporia sp. NBRC 101677]|uniref:SRPBCC family protein n=1 Tax=Kineosporia sp. NBRC 101677 TaxID=3032197 RepID=UPI0024A1063F|nr:SRPBCC family protein [Kineosporia sp. NBRC 101677]GLY18769.1 polyketide cyclase [Kineosporia sp. NBRC 101677]
MSEILVVLEREIVAPPDVTFDALADYTIMRPKILPEQFTGYEVTAGGTGEGTHVTYDLHATKKRVRHVEAVVTEPPAGQQLLESDTRSTLRVLWDVAAAPSGSRVTVKITWQGAGGVKGFFERTFAPGGLKRIYGEKLDRLQQQIAQDAP